jgi:hypothetical protein
VKPRGHEEVRQMAKDNRTYNQKLADKHPPVPTKVAVARANTARQQDAKHQGAANK